MHKIGSRIAPAPIVFHQVLTFSMEFSQVFAAEAVEKVLCS